MVGYFGFVIKFIVIAIIYVILFRIIKIMYLDIKGIKGREADVGFALEVQDAPDSLELSKGSVFPLHTVTNIGRKDDNHIIINDPFISANHATLFIEKGRLYLKDLESTNGTYLNGNKIDDVEEISDGDVIEIGRIIFKVIG
ncbi:FHA domain-containing protein [Caloramator quimbayensis]|uniref:FHA domain-containing protein n=1 Tax=Caloramator quimbayensis TaxID=1147123 RepID=A0A1T4YAD2_9CLOT|nr:FHA domain-containing protein [Caloramator quimbayensis]SKA98488.1 FHA domain-containing protein [Caloramator quimbayensis]